MTLRAPHSPPPERRAVPAGAGLPRWITAQHPLSLVVCALSVLLATALFVDRPAHRMALALDPATREVFRIVTALGNSSWIIVASLGLVIAFRLAAARGSRRRAVLYRHSAGIAGFVLATVAISGIAVNIVKRLVGRVRPADLTDIAFAFHPFRMGSNAASFPSGHTTTIFALAVALACLFPRLRLGLLSIAVWVGCSRVMIGVHWPSDVLAGAALGTATTLVLRHAATARGWVFVWRGGVFDPRLGRLARLIRTDLASTLGQLARHARHAITQSRSRTGNDRPPP